MSKYGAFLSFMLDEGETIKHPASYNEFIDLYSGVPFRDGLYRIFSVNDSEKWNEIVGNFFENYKGKISVFGRDWLGRTFALDLNRNIEENSCVLMLDPATGDVLRMPANFESFHNQEIVEYADECLDSNYYEVWREGNRDLGVNECVGYIIPLHLGGEDSIENMEVVDAEVYWGILESIVKNIDN